MCCWFWREVTSLLIGLPVSTAIHLRGSDKVTSKTLPNRRKLKKTRNGIYSTLRRANKNPFHVFVSGIDVLSIVEYKIRYYRHTDFLPPVLHAVHSKKLAFYSISLEMFLLYSSQKKVLSALEAPWIPPSLASCKHWTEAVASNINYCSNLADIFFKSLHKELIITLLPG